MAMAGSLDCAKRHGFSAELQACTFSKPTLMKQSGNLFAVRNNAMTTPHGAIDTRSDSRTLSPVSLA